MRLTFGISGLFVVGLVLAGCPGEDSSFNAPAGGIDSGSTGTGGSSGGSTAIATLIAPATGGTQAGAAGAGGSEPLAGTGGTVASSKPEVIADSGAPADVSPATGGVDWNTPFVALHADDFRIEVAGKTFLGKTAGASLHSDPGTPNEYTTFEREWTENGVPMSLYIYFDGNGTNWWASEISIYDGTPNGDWLASTSQAFRSPLGQAFTGDLDLTFPGPNPGRLVMQGLRLQAFITPQACLDNTSRAPYVVEVLYPTIEMTTSPNTGFGAAVRLRDANCAPVADDSAFLYVWNADNTAILFVSADGASAGLEGLAIGVTTLRVTAQRRSDGVVVAQGTMLVTITAPKSAY